MNESALDQRVQIVTSRQQIAAIDDWRRHQDELPSRSEAIRRLIEIALAAENAAPPHRAEFQRQVTTQPKPSKKRQE